VVKVIVASVFNATKGTDMIIINIFPKRIMLNILVVICFLSLLGSFGWAAQGGWSVLFELPNQDSEVKVKRPLFAAVDFQRHRYYLTDADQALLIAFDENGSTLGALNPEGSFQKPLAMALGRPGRIWVSDRARNELLYLDLEKKTVRAFTVNYPDNSLIVPDKIAISQQGDLFVLDRMRGQIVQLDDNMKVVRTFHGSSTGHGIIDFVIRDDCLWALQSVEAVLLKFDLSGALKETKGLNGELAFPYALDIDSAGFFYVLDRHAGDIAVFDPNGNFSFRFLSPGRRPGQLHYPVDLCFDWAGRLLVVNEGNGRVEVLGR